MSVERNYALYQIRKLRDSRARFRRITKFLLVLLIAGGLFYWYNTTGTRLIIKELRNTIAELDQQNEQLTSENVELSYAYDVASEALYETSMLAVNMDKQLGSLKDQVVYLDSCVDEYEQREELNQKYGYALVREDGSRTDITIDQIKSLQEEAEALGMDDDVVDLVLSITMQESNGRQDAKNVESTASGYGQILNDTGRFIWTDLMGNGTYSHAVTLDGDTNFEMMLYYLRYLDEKYDGNIHDILNEYGPGEKGYESKINKYLAFSDQNVESINIRK